ncbi:MAG: hypothetical protein V4537_17395 [Pseudomonadota bacterium]
MPRRHYLTATLPDGYVKTIGPTTADFTHYWRIVAILGNGRTEVFWGHVKSLAEAKRKRTATADAARMRGWASHRFEIAELVRSDGLPRPAATD